MSPQEAVALARLVKACCPQQAWDEYTGDAYHDLLGDLRFDDCRVAVVDLGKRQVFIAPAEIRAEVRRLRAKRLDGHEPPDPPPGLDADDTAAYLRWLGESRRAIADGETPAPPPELPSHPMPELRALMAKVAPVSRAVVAAETKRAKDPNFDANLARVRDELAGRREIPMRGDVDTEPTDAA